MMLCPKCGKPASITNSRPSRVFANYELENTVRRRRNCGKCKFRFTTYEITDTMIRGLMAEVSCLRVLQGALKDTIKKNRI